MSEPGFDNFEVIHHRDTEISKEKPFNWRSYLKFPEKMPAELAEKLDFLSSIINSEEPADKEVAADFISEFHTLRNPLQGFINYFRAELGAEERKAINNALGDCEPTKHKWTDSIINKTD